MAWGRHAPHTVETQRQGGDERTAADTERLDIDTDVGDRPAHTWEVDEADSWEPVVPDTWDPPADADEDAPTGDEAAWSDAARSEQEWSEASAEAVPAKDWPGGTVPPANRDVRSGEQAADEFVRSPEPAPRRSELRGTRSEDAAAIRTAPRRSELRGTRSEDAAAIRTGPRPGASEPDTQPPARMALGLASLAAQRMRSEMPAGDGLITGLGLLRQTANGLVAMGERVLAPASLVASIAVKGAAVLPVVGAPVRAALRSGRWLADSGARIRHRVLASVPAGAREQGRETMAAGRSRLSPSSSTKDSQLDQTRLDAEEPVQTFR